MNNQVSVSGGSDNIRYYTSVSHFGQKGTVINSDFRRLSGTSNLEMKVSDRIKIGTRLLFNRNKLNGVRTQEGSSGTTGAGVISAALRFEPTQEFTMRKENTP
ncbi:hypothetical protein [Sphingobacterium sp. E70]|uniref:hypothetical protein n=1 Tax=Sphingobacterium sp. E70 TaxID=2853439 RepID=UPI00359C3F8F